MAHEIDMSNNRANMAFVGEVPWHGLGFELTDGASIEEWQAAAGMNWDLVSRPATYYIPELNSFKAYPGKQVLTRSDTFAPLSIVSDTYKVVQPKEVLEFYRDLVDAAGFKLNTAGVLKGGRKYWALAETGNEATIMGKDQLKDFLLLATSCDGSLATTAKFTSVRVVCNNTLSYSVNNSEPSIRVTHNSTFNVENVKAQLGVASDSWDGFIDRVDALARRMVTDVEVKNFLVRLFGNPEDLNAVEEFDQSKARSMKAVHDLFNGEGLGSMFDSADGTAWGLVNAVTEFTDHRSGSKSLDNRLDSTWFGSGALLKQLAWQAANELVEVTA